jgi:hypothetical protein
MVMISYARRLPNSGNQCGRRACGGLLGLRAWLRSPGSRGGGVRPRASRRPIEPDRDAEHARAHPRRPRSTAQPGLLALARSQAR